MKSVRLLLCLFCPLLIAPWSLAEGMPDPATDREAFQQWQIETRATLSRMLGIPGTRVPLEAEARGQFEAEDIVVEKWVFTAEPGSKVPAVLYRPKDVPPGRLPAVVLTYGHGASKSHPSYNYIGQALAKLNVICLAIDPIGEEERHKLLQRGTRAHDPKHVHEAAWNAGRPIMGKLVFDTMRGVDFLLEREDVDSKRIGVAGNSLGGAVAGWAAVLDARLNCAVVSGWAFGPEVEKWGKFCTRIPNEHMRRQLEWDEYLALAAPHCAILTTNGDSDVIIDREGTGDAWRSTDAAVAKARASYAALGNEEGIATWYEKGGGHRPYPAHPEVLAWLCGRLMPARWNPDQARDLPRLNFGKWAAKHGVQFEGLYGTDLHLRGATMADVGIRYLKPEELRVLEPAEVGTAEFTIEGWLTQVGKEAEGRTPVMLGVAKIEVTPTEPVVLAGYGGRSKEFEGIDTKLWARAMVIGESEPVAVVVLDNCGVPAGVRSRLAERLAKRGITSERLVVAATHTHNAPNLVGYAAILWAGRTTPEQDKHMADYTTFAIEQMEAAVVAAMQAREPLRLEWAQGRATFGGNRRVLRDGKWAGFGFQRDGPVDHSLPVLAARNATGTVRAVWANYACHCTTVGSRNHVGGDWAGFANDSMETEFPEATSLMTIGCGADVGPQPSGNLQIAGEHGRKIGAEVRRLLAGQTNKIVVAPSVASCEVVLPLDAPQSRQHWEEQLKRGGFHGQLAKAMLGKLDAGGAIPSGVDYPVSSWKFGDDLAMVFLPGEVVVDYSVRLNRELDWSRLWITGWANAMPGYIPSKRVLAEGGYEPEFSQVYYEQPGPYKPEVEDVVVAAVRETVGRSFSAKPDQKPAPFHRLPSGESVAFQAVASWARAAKQGEEEEIFQKVRRFARTAGPAVGRITKNDGEDTSWHNFAGDFVGRVFIRQLKKGTELAWGSPAFDDEKPRAAVICFTGGMGWESEPKSDGFALLLGGKEQLRFDVTRKPGRWASGDGTVELVYLPTWTSNLDSGGFFFLALSKDAVTDLDTIPLAVRSLGDGSKRWFAIDSKQEVEEKLKSLSAALGQGRE